MHGSDFRFALRQACKSPGFALTVIVTLALCIGVNTAIFSVLYAVLLRPIPYPEPDHLALVVTASRSGSAEAVNTSQTGALFEAVRDRAPALDTAAHSGTDGANFSAPGRLEYVQQQRVSAGFFRVLGIAPQLGREFTREEDVTGGPALVVLSYGFWQRVFHGDPSILGNAIQLKGEPHLVIGVMPRDFRTMAPVDVWTPLRPSRQGEGGGSNYDVIARLAPGVTWASANDQLRALSAALRDDPAFPREVKDFEDDARFRPERPIPRGLVSLRLIVGLALALGVAAALLTLALDARLLFTLAAVWIWLGLTNAEFFAPRWLKARPFVYLVSHMAITGTPIAIASDTAWASPIGSVTTTTSGSVKNM